MKLVKKIFGICETALPADPDCWAHEDDTIVVDRKRATEISQPGGALRLEGKGLDRRILFFHGRDGRFYALQNKCSHIGGRRIDPAAEEDRLQCCSISGSVYNYHGEVISGPARRPLPAFPVREEDDRLVIELKQ